MNTERLHLEQAILEKYLPRRYSFIKLQHKSAPYLDLGLRTSNGKTYRLHITIPPDYPSQMPQVFVVFPKPLYDFLGRDLSAIGCSGTMHLLGSSNGNIQLCHFNAEFWHQNLTLYKVALKALVWLEAYQNHLITGQDIDYYVRHAQ